MPVLATFLRYVRLLGLHTTCKFFCYFLQPYIAQAAKSPHRAQRAKKRMSDTLGLVHFAIGLVSSVLNLPNQQLNVFWGNSYYRRTIINAHLKYFWGEWK